MRRPYSRFASRGFTLLLILGACSAEPEPESEPEPAATLCSEIPALCSETAATKATLGEPIQVVPSDAMPSEVVSQLAHNNLDVEWHLDRLFFAFRTAPSHFADWDATLYVVSTENLATWRFEGSFALGTDIREPQLVSFQGNLLLYFALLGTNALAFEPQGTRLSEYRSPGDWTSPEPVFDQDFIPWRIKAGKDHLEVTGYTGGSNVYETEDDLVRVHWLRSADGRNFEPMVPGKAVVLEGGGSETDVAWMPDGGIIAVSRNEAGDSEGFGMKVCKAAPESLGEWECVHDKKKYDSPLLIQQGGRVWLIGRRNLTETGDYDLSAEEGSQAEKFVDYQLAYWNSPKRCALWEIDPTSLNVELALDLPSRGDTCFPEALAMNAGQWLVFNYTSPLDTDEDPIWVDGQTGPTHIYRVVLSLPMN